MADYIRRNNVVQFISVSVPELNRINVEKKFIVSQSRIIELDELEIQYKN